MRTMKFVMCVACLCSAAVFARTAMTQEKPVIPQKATIPEPVDDRFAVPDSRRPEPPTGFDDPDQQPRDPFEREGSDLVPNSDFSDDTTPREYRHEGFDEEIPRGNFIPREPGRITPLMRPRRVTRTVIETVFEPMPQEELEAFKKLQAAVQSLKTGKDEAARKAAADVIQQQLTTQFESDLKQREKELAEVEQRVKTLREQLNKRKASQAVIIDLRLQTLVNEADGLAFPDPNFGTDAQNAPTLYGDDLNRPVSRLRQVRQFRQSDPVDPDSRSRESDPHFFPNSP